MKDLPQRSIIASPGFRLPPRNGERIKKYKFVSARLCLLLGTIPLNARYSPQKKSLRLAHSWIDGPILSGGSLDGYNEHPPDDQASRLVIDVLRGRLADYRGFAIRRFSPEG
jgi:hypothetical protein